MLRGPEILGFALFAACAYAAFAQGAIRAPEEPRLEVGVAVIVALAATAWLWFSKLTLNLPRVALTALALLVAFTAWNAVSVFWSVSPDGTWVEVNRVFDYTLILALALAFGASVRNAIELTLNGILALTLIVCAYALGQKVIPGLHIAGLIDLNQTGQVARLQAPLQYWNALALLVTFGAPAALTTVIRTTNSARARITALITLELVVVTIGFTESRGGFIALAVAVGATVILSPDRLTALIWAATAVAAGVLALAIGLLAHPLTASGIDLSDREDAGIYLGVVILAIAVISALAIPTLDRIAPTLTRPRRRTAWRILGYGSVGLIVLAILGAAVSHRGLTGQISHLWNNFNNADSIQTSGAARLFSASSANRVDWWGQAIRAWWTRPFDGYGAGSFPVVDLLFRHAAGIPVQDAHSVPLQWLSDTGIVGAALAVGAWVALIRGGFQAVWRAGRDRIDPTRLDTAPARHRLAAAALLAPTLAYSVHALYDWDWDIPGVTLPVLIMFGVLAGSLRQPPPERPTVLIVPPEIIPRRELGPTGRLTALGAIVAAMCIFAISAILPGIASDKATAAQTEAGIGTRAALSQARHDASVATSLDPLSGAGPMASETVAVHEGELGLARDYALEAIRRQPSDESAWDALVNLDLGLHKDAEALTAAQRVLQLDPEYGITGFLTLDEDAITALRDQAPPSDSATAIATPGF